MGALDDFPVSEMARNAAKREAAEAAAPSDMVEKVTSLLSSAVNGLDERAVYDDYPRLISEGVPANRIVAIKVLLEAGVIVDDSIIDTLKERIIARSLGASAFFEAQHKGDIRDLYLREDGGNG